MTEIRPFRAYHYDTTRIGLSRVIVPPYDVIAPDERAVYYGRDPHSAIRLELTRDIASEVNVPGCRPWLLSAVSAYSQPMSPGFPLLGVARSRTAVRCFSQ